MDKDKVLLTKSGVEKLEEERDNLINVERPRVIEELQLARSQGDLSENADYDAAREKQAEVEHRIQELENMLQVGHYEIISTQKKGKKNVQIGSTVILKFMDTEEEAQYHIVGSTEADPLNGKVSNETPLAQAILGSKTGDVVTVEVAKPYKVTILSIK